MTVSQTLKDRNVRGIQRTSQRAGRGQVSRKQKSLQALRKRATTEALRLGIHIFTKFLKNFTSAGKKNFFKNSLTVKNVFH